MLESLPHESLGEVCLSMQRIMVLHQATIRCREAKHAFWLHFVGHVDLKLLSSLQSTKSSDSEHTWPRLRSFLLLLAPTLIQSDLETLLKPNRHRLRLDF